MISHAQRVARNRLMLSCHSAIPYGVWQVRWNGGCEYWELTLRRNMLRPVVWVLTREEMTYDGYLDPEFIRIMRHNYTNLQYDEWIANASTKEETQHPLHRP